LHPHRRVDFNRATEQMNQQQFDRIRDGRGFIAALDQSGGSTPKALRLYGVGEDAYKSDEQMFDRIHEMRARMITSPAFNGRILGAILFENTMDRSIEGRETADYLWFVKGIVPFLKVDQGLAAEADGGQIMKPLSGLDALLQRAKEKGIFGTKMRSVIVRADDRGIAKVVDQQFSIGHAIVQAGLVPILEPEIDIHASDKAAAEKLLRERLLAGLDQLGADEVVMLKLTLPEDDNFYQPLVDHPRVLRVVALSGGYSRQEANARLARNRGVIASFSRALTEGLSAGQSDAEFNAALDAATQEIHDASVSG
jgi:fructose-bisphosphate aldolase, class I